jgi:hypothetical protein
MMVVTVVSRRVGQMTLEVSERTSCKNLNGLKAIAKKSTSVAGRLQVLGNPNSPQAPNPLSRRMSRLTGSIVRGFQSRAGNPPRRGPAAGLGYVLRWPSKVKVGRDCAAAFG